MTLPSSLHNALKTSPNLRFASLQFTPPSLPQAKKKISGDTKNLTARSLPLLQL